MSGIPTVLSGAREIMTRCMPVHGRARGTLLFAVALHLGSSSGVALAQVPTSPQVESAQGTSLGDVLKKALEVETEAETEVLPPPPLQAAILQGLNKTTARVSTIEAPIGIVAKFGTLEITARACKKKPPTEPPESTAFLEIVDVRPDSPSVSIFAGWMFASSPAISALEHPVYDVWVIDCAQIAAGVPAGVAPSPDSIQPGAQEPAITE